MSKKLFKAFTTVTVTAALVVGSAVNPGVASAKPLYDNTKLGKFFHVNQDTLNSKANGTLIRYRDIPNVLYPATRTLQFVFKTTNSHGKPIAASAVIVRPNQMRKNRPVMVYNDFINSLGVQCQPSFGFEAMAHTIAHLGQNQDYKGEIANRNSIAQVVARQNAANGIATLMPDFLGLKSAYGANVLGSHIILDAMRAVRRMQSMGLKNSNMVLAGYSGGGMAAAWAAAMAPSYAPELKIAGLAAGGFPVDLVWMGLTLGNNHNPGFGIAMASLLGLEREYPTRMNVNNRLSKKGKKLALRNRNACTPRVIDQWKSESITTTMNGVIVKHQKNELRVLYENSLTNFRGAPRIPVFIWGSEKDILVPLGQIKKVAHHWCNALPNQRITLIDVQGSDHITNFSLGLGAAIKWVEGRYNNQSAPNNFCR
ncbi:MAG: lipase family protein [Lawsonella sp.]